MVSDSDIIETLARLGTLLERGGRHSTFTRGYLDLHPDLPDDEVMDVPAGVGFDGEEQRRQVLETVFAGHRAYLVILAAAEARGTEVEALVDDAPTAPPNPPTSPEPWIDTAEVARRLGIDRSTLDLMVKNAPKNLPGSPVAVGEGKKHRFLRWDPARLSEWADAYRVARKRRATS